MRTEIATVDAYMATLPEEARTMLRTLRKMVLAAAPGCGEVLYYGMPTFKVHGPLVGIAAFKKHVSLFPLNGHTIEKFRDRMDGLKYTKACVHFSYGQPIPEDLVRAIVALRLEENLANPLIEPKARRKHPK